MNYSNNFLQGINTFNFSILQHLSLVGGIYQRKEQAELLPDACNILRKHLNGNSSIVTN